MCRHSTSVERLACVQTSPISFASRRKGADVPIRVEERKLETPARRLSKGHLPPVYAGPVKRIQSRDTKFLASGSTDGPHVYPGGDTLGMLSRDMSLGLKNLTLYQTTSSYILQPLLPTLSQTRQNFYSRLNSSYH